MQWMINTGTAILMLIFAFIDVMCPCVLMTQVHQSSKLLFPRCPSPWSGLVPTEGWAWLRHSVPGLRQPALRQTQGGGESSHTTTKVCEIVNLFYPTQQIV